MNAVGDDFDIERWSAEELLVRVAWFYYKDDLTQNDIARMLGLSRASVGRLLDRARKLGVVSINLSSEYLNAFDLSTQLRKKFDLLDVLVVPDFGDEPEDHRVLNARIGVGGAQFISNVIEPGCSLGVGFGDTVSRVISTTNFGAVGSVHLIALTGGVNGYLRTVMSSRVDLATDSEVAMVTVIPGPIVVSTPAMAEGLKQEPIIRDTLQRAREVNLAVVGVGTPSVDATLVQMGYMTPSGARETKKMGVVGDVLGQYYDAQGQIVDHPIHKRRIGIDLSDLRAIPKVIGVAGGLHKTEAILGALRGGFLDVLVTNEHVATRLLRAETPNVVRHTARTSKP
ncbi:MAG: sugar-binding transcriptional regulator [Acidimicrobiales bacterium]